MKAVKYDHKKSVGLLLNILGNKFVLYSEGKLSRLLTSEEVKQIINAGVVSTYKRRVKGGS